MQKSIDDVEQQLEASFSFSACVTPRDASAVAHRIVCGTLLQTPQFHSHSLIARTRLCLMSNGMRYWTGRCSLSRVLQQMKRSISRCVFAPLLVRVSLRIHRNRAANSGNHDQISCRCCSQVAPAVGMVTSSG